MSIENLETDGSYRYAVWEEGGSWWHTDETYRGKLGPFPTREIAAHFLSVYTAGLISAFAEAKRKSFGIYAEDVWEEGGAWWSTDESHNLKLGPCLSKAEAEQLRAAEMRLILSAANKEGRAAPQHEPRGVGILCNHCLESIERGACPDCGTKLCGGPRGGASVNLLCFNCRSRFNVGFWRGEMVWTFEDGPHKQVKMCLAERISKMTDEDYNFLYPRYAEIV